MRYLLVLALAFTLQSTAHGKEDIKTEQWAKATDWINQIVRFGNGLFEEQKKIEVIDDPLLNIRYKPIDNNICQKFDQIEIPSTKNYPLNLNSDDMDFKIPFNEYFQEKHPYPSVLVFIFLVFSIGYLFSVKKFIAKDNRMGRLLAYGSIIYAVLLFVSWANLKYLDTKIIESKSYNGYTKVSKIVTISYEIISFSFWSTNPASKVNAKIIASAIHESLKNGNILAAAKYADYDDEKETAPLREKVFLLTANDLYQKDDLREALHYAEKAFLVKRSDTAYQITQKIRALFAVALASKGQYELSKMELAKLDSAWGDDLRNESWVAVIRLYLQSLNLLDKDQNLDHPRAIDALGKYLQYFSSHNSNQTIPPQLQCMYASFIEQYGSSQLVSNNVEDAIKTFKSVDLLVSNQSVTKELLANYYNNEGLRLSENNDYDKAIVSFEKAYQQTPDNENIKCALSVMQMQKAKDYAMFGNFPETQSRSKKAESLCQFKGIEEISADISLITGQWHMRHGSEEEARQAFSQVKKSSTPEQYKIASLLSRDTYQAKKRLLKIDKSRKWIEHIPRVTGSLCSFKDDPNTCSIVELYDGERRVGKAYADMKMATFEDDGKNLVLEDAGGNGRIDTYRITEGEQRRVIVESDGDYRIDGELIFNKNDELIHEEKFSGRVLIRIPHGVIGESNYDLFGLAPDAYLIVTLNDIYVGHTDYARSTYFPSWSEAFSVNYKKDDQVYIKMMDKDFNTSDTWNALGNLFFGVPRVNKRGQDDDLIDGFVIHKLPESGIVEGIYGKAAIETRIEPTELPEGVYTNKEVEKTVNTFRHADFDNPKVQAIKQRAKRAEEHSKKIADVASFVIPEALNLTIFSELTLAKQILFSFVGSEVLDSQLKNDEE